VKPRSDELSVALEALRNSPIVAESRNYAHRWERARARTASLRGVMFGAAGAIAAACVAVCIAIVALPRVVYQPIRSLIETGTAVVERNCARRGGACLYQAPYRLINYPR